MNAFSRDIISRDALDPPPVRGRESSWRVSVARSFDDLARVSAVRALVYMGEQVCPYEEEFDGNDLAGATHLLLTHRGEPAGVVRMRWFCGFAKLERLAIRKEHRGGPGLMTLARAAFDLAARKGYPTLMGHAQLRVAPFWKRNFGGWIRPGRSTFSFSSYDYVEMEFELHPPADAVSIDSDPFVLLRPEGEWDRPGVLDRFAPKPPQKQARA